MKHMIAALVLLAGVCRAGDTPPVIPIAVHAQAECALFLSGKPLLMNVTLTNGLSTTVRFCTFATEPNEQNSETLNISLVDVYRSGEKRNLYLARPELKVPVSVSGPGARSVKPGDTLRIVVDISKWQIQGGWIEGGYELVFRMDGIIVDDKVTLYVLSDPVRITIK